MQYIIIGIQLKRNSIKKKRLISLQGINQIYRYLTLESS